MFQVLDQILNLVCLQAGYVTRFEDGNGVTQAVADGVTARGSIVLTSADGGIIKLTDSTAGNTGLAKFGFEGQSELKTLNQVVLMLQQ